MNINRTHHYTPTSQPKVLAAFLVAIALLTLLLAMPAEAHADVRKADVIAGATVEERDLTVSECPSISSEHAVLIDEEGTVYFERDAYGPAQIASITKVMTAIVAIENAPDDLYIAVSANAASIGESSAELQEGDILDFDTALKALLVPSGNDAALALAESIGAKMMLKDPSLGSDPVQVFVDAMNKKADEIGCKDTVYENTHGLDYDEYAGNLHSTAYDQALVARYALSYPKIRDIVSGGSTSITVKRNGEDVTIDLETTDQLLDMYEYAIGVKTGRTELAGPCFMGAADNNGKMLYAVVLSAEDEYQRFVDCENLFDWGYNNIKNLKLANTTEFMEARGGVGETDIPVIARTVHADWPDQTVAVTLEDPDAAITVFALEGNVSQSIQLEDAHGTVHVGDKLGTITFKQHNREVAQFDLVACENVPGPNPLDSFIIWWQRLFGGFNGGDETSEPVIYNVMPIIDNNVINAG